jgi:hypothetical protein
MKMKKFPPNLFVAVALMAFVLLSVLSIATSVKTEAATAPAFQATTQTINIPTVTCTSTGQECTPRFSTTVTVLAGNIEVQFTPSSLHCSTLAANLIVNGAVQTTSFLAPGASSPFFNFGAFAAGTYTIEVQGIGQVNGCNTGTLFNWMGAINVRANFPSSPYNECLRDDSLSNIARFNATTGAYEFTNCAGVIISGVGTVQIKGSVINITHVNSTRRFVLRLDRNTRRGTASLQTFEPAKEYLIADSNSTNNICTCP